MGFANYAISCVLLETGGMGSAAQDLDIGVSA